MKIDDDAQLAADQARALTEQAIEDQKDKINESIDIAKENTEEAFWSTEDKKWQALDAVQTAEAKIDGSIASNSPALARSYNFVVPYLPGPVVSPIAPIHPVAPINHIAPINTLTPIVYATPGIIHADKLKILKEQKEELERKIEYLEKEKEKYDMIEKQKYELLQKQKYEIMLREQEKQTLVKTADLEKDGEKKAALEKNLLEKPAVLLYSVLPQAWSQPLYVQNPLVLK